MITNNKRRSWEKLKNEHTLTGSIISDNDADAIDGPRRGEATCCLLPQATPSPCYSIHVNSPSPSLFAPDPNRFQFGKTHEAKARQISKNLRPKSTRIHPSIPEAAAARRPRMKITVMTADEQIISLDVDPHESVKP